MVDPSLSNQQQAGKHGSTTWAHSSEGDERRLVKRDRNEQRWLHKRMEELERRLRLQRIVLSGALPLNALLVSFMIISFYKSEPPQVVLAAAPSSDMPRDTCSVMWNVEQRSHIQRSQVWAMGEEWIETSAALHLDAQRTQASTEQPVVTRQDAGGAEATKAETSAKRGIFNEGKEAVARGCSRDSPEAEMSAFPRGKSDKAAQAGEGIHYAATDFLNLRAAPSNSADVLTVVGRGDLVRRTGHGLGWLQVEYRDPSASSIRGWVYSSYLRHVEPSAGSPYP